MSIRADMEALNDAVTNSQGSHRTIAPDTELHSAMENLRWSVFEYGALVDEVLKVHDAEHKDQARYCTEMCKIADGLS